MSKIGQQTIPLPKTVAFEQKGSIIVVKGPNGELTVTVPAGIEVSREGDTILVKRQREEKRIKSLHGLYRQLILNAIVGVEKAWEKKLEVVGTGFNVKLQGEELVFKLGYSHLKVFAKVPGITYKVDGNTKVIVSGADKQLVGQVAYQIKLLRKPDAYKGKGIRYEGEVLRIKPGKKAKTAGGAGAA